MIQSSLVGAPRGRVRSCCGLDVRIAGRGVCNRVLTVLLLFLHPLSASSTPLALFVRSSAPGADSRVPESVVLGRKPGEIFVHRNIANQFHHNDDSANAVLTYAVKHLGVQHGEFSLKSGEGGETREEDRRMSDYMTRKSSDDFFYRIPRTTPIESWQQSAAQR